MILPKNAWPYAIVILAALAALAFGILTFSTNLFVAVGVGLIVVGAAKLFTPGGSTIGIVLLVAGGVLWLGNDLLPSLTIAQGLSIVGVR